jgi:hypothetical protein
MEEYPTIRTPFNISGHVHDPIYSMMLKRKQQEESDASLPPQVNYANDDIIELEEFCRTHGILGFNCGNMHPKAALRILRGKMGIPTTENIIKPKLLLD